MSKDETGRDQDRLLADYLAGHLSERGKARLLAWLRADPEHMTEFVRHIDTHASLTEEFRGGQAIQDILASVRTRKRPPARLYRLFPLAAAASALLALGIGLWVSRTTSAPLLAQVQSVQGQAFGLRDTAAAPERWALRVGDEVQPGTRIETGADSTVTLVWPTLAATVALGGDAKLETRDGKPIFLRHGQLSASVAQRTAGHPFAVETRHALATVTGTRFELDARPELTLLTVRDGAVDFTDFSQEITTRVAAGYYAMAVPGGRLQPAPIGTDMPANYDWDFRGPPDPDVLKVARGHWRHVPEEQCMETDGEFDLLINLPVHGLPVAVEYEIRGAVTKAMKLTLGTVFYDYANQVDLAFRMHHPKLLVPPRAQWMPESYAMRGYVTESSVIMVNRNTGQIQHIQYYRAGHEGARLVLGVDDRARLYRLSARSVAPEDVPDTSLFQQDLASIPEAERKGIIERPDPRPGQERHTFHWGFQRQFHKLTPFEY